MLGVHDTDVDANDIGMSGDDHSDECDHEGDGHDHESDDCNHECHDDSDHGSESASYSDNEASDYVLVSEENKCRRELARLIGTEKSSLLSRFYMQYHLYCLNPQFRTITSDSIKDEILKIYKEEKEKIKFMFRNFDGQISLSVDVLRCEEGGEYMCLAAHFIDDNWELKRWVLNFRRICYSFEDDLLVEAAMKSLSDWEIRNKISTFTFQICWYYDEAIDLLKDFILEKKQLQLNGQLFRVYCCADIFKLMVQDAFEEIDKIIPKVEELMCCGKSKVMWHLTYDTLKHAFELESNENYFANGYDSYDKPSADEWKKVEGVCKILGSVYNVAKVLFETNRPTANNYLQNFRELHTALTQESMSSDSFISAVANKMLQKFEKSWKDMFLVLAIATVMDPRYKMKYIEFSSLKCAGTDCNLEVTTVLEAIHSLYDGYVTHNFDRDKSVCDSNFSDSDKEEFSRGVEEGCHKSNDWLLEYNQFIQSANRPLKSELDLYLEEPVLPWSQDFNILSWWRAASPKYPTLSRMARDFLAIPVSVPTSVNAYYTIEREVDPDLKSSGPDLMNALMCTRSWLQKK